ncbi:Transport and Golgi organization protein 2 [Coemansia aciculifera]|uniref:Transport and Golgi organization protein 2 n=1 Tax=Coemansia aciculifera TaxID=417176 RepID=A0ACC1M5P1_9FUNG|nr:Transport and Golgi organization protein 2 [Coemansia aciculifera]
MCVTFWKLSSSSASDGYRLVLAFNRDEFFDRPTLGFHHWPPPASGGVFAPQDLQPADASQRGAWLGLNTHHGGRLALLTNFRELTPLRPSTTSRGPLVRNYLLHGTESPWEYAQAVYKERQRYDGFNLVLFDLLDNTVIYVTNRGFKDNEGTIQRLTDEDGRVVGLSNSSIDDCAWPKVRYGKEAFARALAETSGSGDEQELVEALMQVMSDTGPFDQQKDHTPQRLDDLKQCIFVPEINSIYPLPPGRYGTRTTDVILVKGRRLTVAEREHDNKDQIIISHIEI